MQRFGLLALVFGLSLSPAALAGPPAELARVDSPREAYSRATRAWKAGDKENAAYWFARADALQPSDRALVSALRAAKEAGLPLLSMVLAERASRAGASAEVSALAAELSSKHGKSIAKIRVSCPTPGDCAVEIDSAAPPEAGVVTPESIASLGPVPKGARDGA